MSTLDARRSDRYLISHSKCPAVLETDDGQVVQGHICDASAGGCLFVAPSGQLKLVKGQRVWVSATGHRVEGSAMRSHVFGARAYLGIKAPMPTALLDWIRGIGGALRFDRRTITVINILTMPVAVHGMRLIRLPETQAIDLAHCTGMEIAGAGFLIIARQRGLKIQNVGGKVAAMVEIAGIPLTDG